MDKEVLKILACPACKAAVKFEDQMIVCTGCGLRYPVKDGIPVMLIEEAEQAKGKNG